MARLRFTEAHALQSDDSFVLCDANSNGYPIRYASKGFEEMFGHDVDASAARSVGDLFGGPSILGCLMTGEAVLAVMPEMPKDIAMKGCDLLARMAAAEVEKATASQESCNQAGRALLVCKKKDGSPFVCELLVQQHQHPSLGWFYSVGLHKDVTAEVSVLSLVKAAADSTEKYEELLGRRKERMEDGIRALRSPQGAQLLHGAAGHMWQSLVAQMMAPHHEKKQKQMMDSRSAVSASTAASRQSRQSRRSVQTTASSAITWTSTCTTSSRKARGSSSQGETSAQGSTSAAFHLAALLGGSSQSATLPPSAPIPTLVEEQACEASAEQLEDMEEEWLAGRFLDLLEDPDYEDLENVAPAKPNLKKADTDAAAKAVSVKDFQVSPPCRKIDGQLEQAMSKMMRKELRDLDFSMVLADPSLADCPLLLSSAGFYELTGYTAAEAAGQNCRFLLNGVPEALICEDSRTQCKKFCDAATSGKYYHYEEDDGVHGVALLGGNLKERLPEGELVCKQMNAKKSGGLFCCMMFMKQVELDEEMFVVAVQAHCPDPDVDPEEYDRDAAAEDVTERCELIFRKLNEQMDVAIQVLASQFWYSAPMRRQVACSDSD